MTKKNILIFIVLSLTVFSFFGCSNKKEEVKVEEKIYEIETPVKEVEKVPEIKGIKSVINGTIIDEKMALNRPLVIMLDNHYMARPQAGLSKADIVYEILAEGNITRYEAVFQSNLPTNIGPIRSARPYYILKALEYDSIYVHVGGSEQAKKDIKKFGAAEVDGLSSGGDVFWRKDHKKIPHNMYSNSEAIYKEALRKKYREDFKIDSLKFNDEVEKISDEICDYVKIVYKKPSSSDKTGYYVEFKYDEASKKYLRYVNGKEHIDEDNNEKIVTDNIFIQYARHKTIDNEGRIEIALVGEGKGYYISNGNKKEILWKKEKENTRTKYFDNEGKELYINPGVSWIQVIPTENELEW